MADLTFEQKLLQDIVKRNLAFWQTTTTSTAESDIAELIEDNDRMQLAIGKALSNPDLWEQTVDTLLDIFVYIERLRLQREWTGWLQATFDTTTDKQSPRYCLLLNRLGQMKRYLEGREEIAVAIALHQEAAALAAQLDDKALEGLSYFQLSEDYRLVNEPVQAKNTATRAVELCQASKAPVTYLAAAHSSLGLAHLDLSEFAEAETNCQKAYRLYKENGHTFEEGTALLNIGLIKIRQEQPDEGLKKYLAAEKLFTTLGAKYDLYVLKINLASFYYYREDFDAAEKAFQEIETKYLIESGQQFLLAMKTHGLGDVAHAKGDPKKALPFLNEAVSRWQLQEQPFRLAYTLATRKGVYLDLNEPEKAKEDHKVAKKLIAQNPDHYEARGAQAVLDKWDRKQGGVSPSGNTPPKSES